MDLNLCDQGPDEQLISRNPQVKPGDPDLSRGRAAADVVLRPASGWWVTLCHEFHRSGSDTTKGHAACSFDPGRGSASEASPSARKWRCSSGVDRLAIVIGSSVDQSGVEGRRAALRSASTDASLLTISCAPTYGRFKGPQLSSERVDLFQDLRLTGLDLFLHLLYVGR